MTTLKFAQVTASCAQTHETRKIAWSDFKSKAKSSALSQCRDHNLFLIHGLFSLKGKKVEKTTTTPTTLEHTIPEVLWQRVAGHRERTNGGVPLPANMNSIFFQNSKWW